MLNFEPAAEVFPTLLDYMYGLDDGNPPLTIDTAVPVYHLADYFEVESLHPKILAFWNENMVANDLTTCLQQAKTFRIEPLREIVVKKCFEKISDVTVDSPLLEETDSNFWVDVDKEMEEQELHPRFFALVAEFCFRRKGDLDAETFKTLTGLFSKYWWPLMSFDDAVKLLEVEQAALPACEEVTQLQRDMVGVLMLDWKRLKDSTTVQDLMKRTSPLAFSHAVQRSVEMAHEECEALGQVLDETSASLPTRITVSGCGINAANGVYSRHRRFHRSDPIYFMNGFYEGNADAATFSIERSRTGLTGDLHWYISVKKPGCSEETDLYTSALFINERLHALPRMSGWWGFVDDDASQPSLTYHFD